MIQTIPVQLAARGYDVCVGPKLLDEVGPRTRRLVGGQAAFVITDSNVGPLYARRVAASLTEADFVVRVHDFPAGESHKTLATVEGLFDRIFAAEIPPDRDSVIVALGGGVAGDVAGFVAATLLRGVAVVQVPTTLLADVDSSVGGKTGVDHPAGKNLIGAFHQPRGVFIDPGALATLPEIELAAGLAECVKHGIIRDAGLLDWIEAQSHSLIAGDEELFGELIARNVAIKAAVVAADEREAGERAHLNFGHTIGHAIEAEAVFAAGGPGDLRHGHCVALGMVAANQIAVRRGLLSGDEAQRVEALLAELGLAVRRAGVDGERLLGIMRRDKKARGGVIRFVLPAGQLGRVAIYDDVTDEEILDAIEYLA